LTESSVPLVLSKQYQRSFAVTSADLTLNIDDFSKRFVRKAISSMANEIDFDGLGLFNQVYNEVGTPGTVPVTTAVYLAAGTRLDNEACPRIDRNLCINPGMNGAIVGALTGLFNPQATISQQFKKGLMSKDTLGLDWYLDQNVRMFTTGPQGGSPLEPRRRFHDCQRLCGQPAELAVNRRASPVLGDGGGEFRCFEQCDHSDLSGNRYQRRIPNRDQFSCYRSGDHGAGRRKYHFCAWLGVR